MIEKTLYIPWLPGWVPNSTPSIVWDGAKSWIARNPDWNVKLLSKDNLYRYVTKSFMEEIKHLPYAQKNQLIKIKLLYENPGVCVDATTFCLKPLDSWFNESMLVDDTFFIVPNLIHVKDEYPKNVADMSFLYSGKKHNPIFDISNYTDYSDIFKSFNDNIADNIIQEIIDKSPDMHRYNKYGGLLATGIFQLSDQKLATETITPEFLKKMDMKAHPFFKLSLKVTTKDKKYQNLTDERINIFSIEKHYGKKSKLNFINEVLKNEIKNNS
jgi:hypothetical protein